MGGGGRVKGDSLENRVTSEKGAVVSRPIYNLVILTVCKLLFLSVYYGQIKYCHCHCYCQFREHRHTRQGGISNGCIFGVVVKQREPGWAMIIERSPICLRLALIIRSHIYRTYAATQWVQGFWLTTKAVQVMKTT